jgi:SAM-dependent methyltransferase
MNVFGDYAAYYDLLYHDKDYAAEVAYVDTLIKKYKPTAQSMLDVGCGTGKHAAFFANAGYTVHGIDLSQDMVSLAQKQHANDAQLSFSCADARTFNLQQSFDVAVSLFHVMSYHITHDDIKNTCTHIYDHLKPGGLFIFDCWYGPAVLSDPPVVRIKRVENNDVRVVRIAEPTTNYNKNYVDINFTLYVHDKKHNTIGCVQETHSMRYLFEPEMVQLFEQCGFSFVAAYEWLVEKRPGATSWNVCFVGQK